MHNTELLQQQYLQAKAEHETATEQLRLASAALIECYPDQVAARGYHKLCDEIALAAYDKRVIRTQAAKFSDWLSQQTSDAIHAAVSHKGYSLKTAVYDSLASTQKVALSKHITTVAQAPYLLRLKKKGN